MKSQVPKTPLWSDVIRASLALLVINLLWNEPIGRATGGGLLPLFIFNLMPSAAALYLILYGSAKRARSRSKGSHTGC